MDDPAENFLPPKLTPAFLHYEMKGSANVIYTYIKGKRFDVCVDLSGDPGRALIMQHMVESHNGTFFNSI